MGRCRRRHVPAGQRTSGHGGFGHRQRGARSRLPDQAPGLQGSHRADSVRGRPAGGLGKHGTVPGDHPCRPAPRAHASAALGVDLRLGVEVAAINQDGDSARVDFTDGSSGEFDLLVGADGLHSSIRRHMSGGADPVRWARSAGGSSSTVTPASATGPSCSVAHGHSWQYPSAEAASLLPRPVERRWRGPDHGDPGRLEDVFGDFADPAIDLIRAATKPRPFRTHRRSRHRRLGERPGCPGG